tara:strand:- start:494 stop:760 length:267 start_codon:yes stop_codon:yes gene_type:complete
LHPLNIFSFNIFLSFWSNSFAQTFNIGHTSTVLYDNIRNRDVTEIYYHADSNRDDVSISIGNFPVIVFGHGFLISWDAYENFWIPLVL